MGREEHAVGGGREQKRQARGNLYMLRPRRVAPRWSDDPVWRL